MKIIINNTSQQPIYDQIVEQVKSTRCFPQSEACPRN